MAKTSCDSKVRILAVYHIILQRPKISAPEIIRILDLKYDIRCDRKTIYDDIRAIDRFLPIKPTCGMYGGFEKWDFSEVMQE